MKKLLAIFIAVMMLLSLAACGLNGEIQGGIDRGGESQVENQDSDGNNEENNAPKTDKSRTLDLYKEYFSGPYTLRVENYVKDFRDPDTKTLSSKTLNVVDGSKSYSETTSSPDFELSTATVVIDDYKYTLYHTTKMIVRSAVSSKKTGNVIVMHDEAFYNDMLGDVEEKEIFGEKYECEKFSSSGTKITYCYKGDELKYIIADSGGVDIIFGVVELTKGADSTYFELPEDYEKNY